MGRSQTRPKEELSKIFWTVSNAKSQIDPLTTLALRCIAVTAFISVLPSLITFDFSTAFNGVASPVVAGIYSSYLIVCSPLLYHRCVGAIQPYEGPTEEAANDLGQYLVWGPWRVPGIFCIVNNTFACLYMMIVFFWSF